MDQQPLLVFADDWGRHPSICQHLVRQLMHRHPVTWVNTIGTRTPRFDLATVKRGLGKVRQWLRPVPATPEPFCSPQEVEVLNPRMWPWFTRKIDRWLNRKLLLRQLRPTLNAIDEPPVAVTTLPIVTDLMGPLPVSHWVYYCVDDFSQWPGLDRKPLGRMERLVVERADVVVAVSENLQERLRKMGRDSELLTHGVDLDCWTEETDTASILAGLPRPLVVFWGVVDQRMDIAFLRQLAATLTEGTIVLVGPENDPDPELKRLPRVVLTGAVPFEKLPAIAQEAAVLVMPYAYLPVTRAMQPLKLKEYLATGKPVVVRELPATHEWADCLDQVRDPVAFANLVRQRLESGLPAAQTLNRQRLEEESWIEKTRVFEHAIFSQQSSLMGVC